MRRTAPTLPDPTTGATHAYAGVKFETLIQNGLPQSESQIIEVCFGSRQIVTIPSGDLDPTGKPRGADTVDGKQLTADVPYYFIAKTRQNHPVPIKNLKLINVKSFP